MRSYKNYIIKIKPNYYYYKFYCKLDKIIVIPAKYMFWSHDRANLNEDVARTANNVGKKITFFFIILIRF